MNEGIILGDSLATEAQEFTPQLTGMGEEKVVAVFNPLPHDFRVAFSRPQAYQPTPDPNRQFAREKGLPLDKSNPKSYVTQDVVLPAGKIKNLPGDIAQIAVRKLVSAIIQTRNADGSYDFEGHGGQKGMVPDPHLRQETEKELIKGIYDATEFFNRPPQQTTETVTQQQIANMNEDKTNEQQRPAPGTGSHYTPKAAVPAGAGQPSPAQPPTPQDAKSPASA